MKKLILLGLTSSFLFAGGISVSVKPVDNTIYEKSVVVVILHIQQDYFLVTLGIK